MHFTMTMLFAAQTHLSSLPANLLMALCYVESRHKITAVHHDDGRTDSLGVCQIKLETAKGLGYKGTAKGLMQPDVNVRYSALYLKHQITRYHGDTTKAVIAYNQGSAKSLTSTKYSRKVMKEWRTYSARQCKTNFCPIE